MFKDGTNLYVDDCYRSRIDRLEHEVWQLKQTNEQLKEERTRWEMAARQASYEVERLELRIEKKERDYAKGNGASTKA